jgi:hypothetical protein
VALERQTEDALRAQAQELREAEEARRVAEVEEARVALERETEEAERETSNLDTLADASLLSHPGPGRSSPDFPPLGQSSDADDGAEDEEENDSLSGNHEEEDDRSGDETELSAQDVMRTQIRYLDEQITAFNADELSYMKAGKGASQLHLFRFGCLVFAVSKPVDWRKVQSHMESTMIPPIHPGVVCSCKRQFFVEILYENHKKRFRWTGKCSMVETELHWQQDLTPPWFELEQNQTWMLEDAAVATNKYAVEKGTTERKWDILNPIAVPSVQQEYVWKKVKLMRNDMRDALGRTLKQTKVATSAGQVFRLFYDACSRNMKYHEGKYATPRQRREQDAARQAFPTYLTAPWLRTYDALDDDCKELLESFDTKKKGMLEEDDEGE